MNNPKSLLNRGRVKRDDPRISLLRDSFASRYSLSGLLLLFVILFDLLFVTSSFILTQYFGENVATSVTFVANDGNWAAEAGGSCDLATEGVGAHCFGDYTLATRFAERADPWAPFLGYHFNYPAGSLLPHRVAVAVGNALGEPRVGLFLYLAALLASLCAPAIWASRGKAWHQRAGVIALFGVATMPGLIALDRGNSVALAAAPMLMFLVGLRRGKHRLTVIAVILTALVKPQYVVLLLILVALRKWRAFAVGLVGVGVTQVLAFVVWPSRFPHTIPEALANTLQYGQTAGLSGDFPTNVSLARGVYIVARVIQTVFNLAPSDSLASNATLAGTAIIAVTIAIVIIAGRRIEPWLGGVALIVVASLFATTSFSYYLIFALPVAAILLRDPLRSDEAGPAWLGVLAPAGTSRGVGFAASCALVFATAATITKVVLPHHLVSMYGNFLATSGDFVPFFWTVALTMALWSNFARRSGSATGIGTAETAPLASRPTAATAVPELPQS